MENVTKHIKLQRGTYKFFMNCCGRHLEHVLDFHYTREVPKNETCLVLYNHNRKLDSVMVALGTGIHMKNVGSANLLNGFKGKILGTFFGLIPRKRGFSADETVELIQENLREGISVGLLPEGTRSWDGGPSYISPRTATLVRNTGAALVTYRIDGAYLQNPRWSKVKRKGPAFGHMVSEISPAELEQMTDEEIYERIVKDLQVEAFDFQREHQRLYKAENRADGLQNILYLCPNCKKFSTIKTSGNDFFCSCGLKGTYLESGFFDGNIPFRNTREWNLWQKKYLRDERENLKRFPYALSVDEGVSVRIPDSREKPLVHVGTLRILKDRFEISGRSENKKTKEILKEFIVTNEPSEGNCTDGASATKKVTDKAHEKNTSLVIKSGDEIKMHIPLTKITRLSVFGNQKIFCMISGNYFELDFANPVSGPKYEGLWRTLTDQEYL